MDKNWYTNENVWSLSFFHPDLQEYHRGRVVRYVASKRSDYGTPRTDPRFRSYRSYKSYRSYICRHGMLRRICVVQIQPRKPVILLFHRSFRPSGSHPDNMIYRLCRSYVSSLQDRSCTDHLWGSDLFEVWIIAIFPSVFQ